jgi:hypothetical protein
VPDFALLRVDRFWLGMAALVLSSLAMAVLVLLVYFRAWAARRISEHHPDPSLTSRDYIRSGESR